MLWFLSSSVCGSCASSPAHSIDMATLPTFAWWVAGALLAVGSVALGRGVHDCAVDRGIERRFHVEILSQRGSEGATGLVMKYFEWLGRKAAGVGSVRRIQIQLQRAGFS